MRDVEWSKSAQHDLHRNLQLLAETDPPAAEKAAARIVATAAGLSTFAMGRRGRVADTFEKPVAGLPYIIAYILDDAGEVSAVGNLPIIHGARDHQATGRATDFRRARDRPA